MISLVSLSAAYLLSLFIGSRGRRIGRGTYLLLAAIAVVQVLLVMVAMFTMDPPVFKRFGQ